MEALFTAVTERCAEETTTSAAWEEAVSRCDAAAMQWEQAIAVLAMGAGPARRGSESGRRAVPLRSTYRFAVEVDAIPLQHQWRQWLPPARSDPRIRRYQRALSPPAPFRSLTKREQEVPPTWSPVERTPRSHVHCSSVRRRPASTCRTLLHRPGHPHVAMYPPSCRPGTAAFQRPDFIWRRGPSMVRTW
jgi:hypothetical protein